MFLLFSQLRGAARLLEAGDSVPRSCVRWTVSQCGITVYVLYAEFTAAAAPASYNHPSLPLRLAPGG